MMKKYLKLAFFAGAALIFLAGCGGGTDSSDNAAATETKDAYVVLVTDESNAPVVGAGVQLCSNEMCFVQTTDDAGIATFEVDEGTYTVHMHSIPEGFAPDKTEYEVPEKYGIVTIVLKAAE